jgi:UDP-N-acetylmuramate: L-alanyl-gamma-D-glutamyl-meso-diaminopimelate ligase
MKDLSSLPDAELRVFERPPVPDAEDLKRVYLIGICGTGMGSLAGLLQQTGCRVYGSDEAAYPPMSTRLAEMGVHVLEGFTEDHLKPPPDLVIVGNACTPRHVEAAFARDNHLPQLSLPEALAHFYLKKRRSLVVAGTHGKTTTTGLLVHALRSAGLDPGFMVGGVMVNGNVSYGVGRGRHFVVEGDEYDSAYFDKRPKMMHYLPHSAIITSVEFDHADIYDDWDAYLAAFREFAGTISPEGTLALNGDDRVVRELAEHASGNVRLYGLSEGMDVSARHVRYGAGGQRFSLMVDGEIVEEIFFPMSGRHNLMNVLAVCTIALSEGMSPTVLADGIAQFKGMRRRQEIRGDADGVLVIDDFAHHPTAVRETVRAIADRWPERRVVAVFEPRSNSSRRKVFEQAYSEAFGGAEHVFLSMPPIRHNDSADDLLNADTVSRIIREGGIPAAAFESADAVLPHLVDVLRPGDVALIMSNGGFGNIHDRLLQQLRERERAREILLPH